MTEPTASATEGGPIRPDRFQREAMDAIDRGSSVLVAAPTGAGKTLVAEHAVATALREGRKAFYTTPIKALSNQKYLDLRGRYGDQVGLLTGDNSINGDAPVVVMTTEVLRNMIYVDAPALDELGWVVLDEVHYLRDPYRGPVWEEIIVHAPAEVGLVCLSATVSNVDELTAWISSVRGPTELVLEEERPVELRNLYMVDEAGVERAHLLPVLVDGRANPRGDAFDVSRSQRGRRRRGYRTPRRVEVVERLGTEDLLPAIYFLFSRAGCDDAADQCHAAGLTLTSAGDRETISAIAEERVRELSSDDLDLLGYPEFLARLQAGIAAHHAGMVPPFKEAVERCFTAGLVQVVFATETLALGVNMPARSVVLERLTKYNGATHEILSPLEYTQLTGRAGRRGIDTVGHAVVLWSPWVSFGDVAALAASRSFGLVSAFRPTYNMVANLIDRFDEPRVMELLGRSFAQFQADRSVVALEQQLSRRVADVGELERAAQCERGDVAEYRELLGHRRAQVPTRRARRDALAELRPGDVIDLPDGAEVHRVAVISVAHRSRGEIRIKAIDRQAELHEASDDRFENGPEALARIDLPAPFTPASPSFRADVAGRLSRTRVKKRRRHPAPPIDHPVHDCPDATAHLDALRRLEREQRRVAGLEGQIRSRSGSLARQFGDVRGLLEDRGYLDGWSVTDAGHRLAGVFHELDLLVSDALGAGLFDGLEPAGVAALASCLTFEERTAEPPPRPTVTDPVVRERIARLQALATELRAAEIDRIGRAGREPDPGFAATAHRWASGRPLRQALDPDLSGGDFVRNVKQLVDLVRQLSLVAPVPATRRAFANAAVDLQRGVVVDSIGMNEGIDDDPAG